MFDITSCADFYAVLVQDFDDYMSETHSARKAVHCAISAYHLREWVWKDWLAHDSSAQKAIGILDEVSFNAWVNRCCVWFRLLRDLANGMKHFTNKANFQTIRVMAVPFAWGQKTAGWGEGAWDGLLAKTLLLNSSKDHKLNKIRMPIKYIIQREQG